MTKNAKIILGIVVAVIVIGGAIWFWGANNAGQNEMPYAYNSTSTSNGTTSGISSNGTSDAQLNADLATTDSQMSSFNSDSANINQGLNDQPVQQQQF